MGSQGMMQAQQAELQAQQQELGLQAQEVGIDYMKKMPAADKDTAAMIMAPVLTGQPLTPPMPAMGGPGMGPPGAPGAGGKAPGEPGAPVAGQPAGGKQGAAMGLKVPPAQSPMGAMGGQQQPMPGQQQQPPGQAKDAGKKKGSRGLAKKLR
jgi:hypothetical protein